jgi:flagellar hook protein FlgE
MSLIGSLYSAASGLGAHADAMDVVSDNIANVNTVGYKSGRGRFEDVLGSTVASTVGTNGAGQGSRLAGVDRQFAQGALLGTGNATDLAVQGDGFFVTRGSLEGVDGVFYTRAGQFHLDTEGQLVDPRGLVVQGYAADAQGRIGSTVTDLRVPSTATVPPRASTSVALAANLDASSTVLPAFTAATRDTTSNFSTSVAVYDSLGAAHNVDVYFHKGAAGWDWHALVDSGDLGGLPGTPTECANGALTFTTSGYLDTQTTALNSFSFAGAAGGQSIAFDFGDAITTNSGTGRTGVTAYASASSVSSIKQDGYSAGSLVGVGVSEDGRVTGAFTNGERRTLGQVATARFRDNEGLVRAGAGYYVASEASGAALVGAAGSGGRGSIASGSLEQSNVDMSQEFVALIALQHGYQANSRTIRTADDMLSELVNLKR